MAPDHTKLYVAGAFALGAALTILYQSQNQRHQENQTSESHSRQLQLQQLLTNVSNVNDLIALKKSLAEIERTLVKGGANIKEGVEGCIGNTPLIKIKSLSEATGCEILAKAEVRGSSAVLARCGTNFYMT
jgi:cysteine synthase